MAKVEFEVGDKFAVLASKENEATSYGVVTADTRAVMIRGAGGRLGYQITTEAIPRDALILTEGLARKLKMSYEVGLALRLASEAVK